MKAVFSLSHNRIEKQSISKIRQRKGSLCAQVGSTCIQRTAKQPACSGGSTCSHTTTDHDDPTLPLTARTALPGWRTLRPAWVGIHLRTQGRHVTWKKPNTEAKVNNETERALTRSTAIPDGSEKMSSLPSGLLERMVTSWKMYGSLSLIIHAPGNVTYRAGERKSKISSRPYFSEVNE